MTSDLPPLERAMDVTVPTQILVGGKSPTGLHDVASQLTKAIPNATFAELPGQDHMVGAKALVPKLIEFLKHEEA